MCTVLARNRARSRLRAWTGWPGKGCGSRTPIRERRCARRRGMATSNTEEPGILPGGMAARIATRLATLGAGPRGKMPPSTAGKDARRYLVAVPRGGREERRGEKAFNFTLSRTQEESRRRGCLLPAVDGVVAESHLGRLVSLVPFGMGVGEEDVLPIVVRFPPYGRSSVGSAADTILRVVILVIVIGRKNCPLSMVSPASTYATGKRICLPLTAAR